MKIKLVAIVAILLLSTGCVKDQLIKTVYVEKKVPVNAVPAPPEIPKPIYEVSKLTPAERNDLGTFVKAVTTDSKAKDGYIEILETVINKYKELAKDAEVQVEPVKLPEANVVVGEPETVRSGPPQP